MLVFHTAENEYILKRKSLLSSTCNCTYALGLSYLQSIGTSKVLNSLLDSMDFLITVCSPFIAHPSLLFLAAQICHT